MIKKDIVDQLYHDHGGMTRAETEQHVNMLLDILGDAINDGPVTIANFGKFRHKSRNVREVTLPDGRKKLTSGTNRIQFVPSPALKTKINADSGDNPDADT